MKALSPLRCHPVAVVNMDTEEDEKDSISLPSGSRRKGRHQSRVDVGLDPPLPGPRPAPTPPSWFTHTQTQTQTQTHRDTHHAVPVAGAGAHAQGTSDTGVTVREIFQDPRAGQTLRKCDGGIPVLSAAGLIVALSTPFGCAAYMSAGDVNHVNGSAKQRVLI